MKWYVKYKDAISLTVFMSFFAGTLWLVLYAVAQVKG